MSRLTVEQYNYLLRAIHPDRVKELKNMKHLEAWEVRRTLNRIFGFCGWDKEILSKDLAHMSSTERRRFKMQDNIRVEYGEPIPAWTVVYTVTLRLVIKDRDGTPIAHFDDGAAGTSANQPSVGDAHDMALKTAISQALKRAATDLGDQFGLSLYNGNSLSPVVVATLVPPTDDLKPAGDLPVGTVNPEPLPYDEDGSPPIGAGAEPRGIQPEQREEIAALWRDLSLGSDEQYAKRMEIVRTTLRVPSLESTWELNEADAQVLIYELRKRKARTTRQPSGKAASR